MPIISFTVSIWIYPTLTTPGCCIHASRIYLLAWPFRMVYKMHRLHHGMRLSFPILQTKQKFNSNLVVGKSVILFASTLMLTVLMINTTPDVPLIFFWTLTILFFYHAIFEDKTIYWLLGGMAMGLAFDSKYTALMLPAGLILFLLLSQKYRPYLISYKVILAFLVWIIFIAPVIIWNVQHDWMSFRFQSNDRASAIMSIQPKWNYFLEVWPHKLHYCCQYFLLLSGG